jgi:hypothetical protein
MPFCPNCETEFQPEVLVCPDCEGAIPLVDALPSGEEDVYDLVEVYACADLMEANAICSEILEPEGIESRVHDFTSSAFPVPITQGERRIAVPSFQAEQAIALIQAARTEGAISLNGVFLAQLA